MGSLKEAGTAEVGGREAGLRPERPLCLWLRGALWPYCSVALARAVAMKGKGTGLWSDPHQGLSPARLLTHCGTLGIGVTSTSSTVNVGMVPCLFLCLCRFPAPVLPL